MLIRRRRPFFAPGSELIPLGGGSHVAGRIVVRRKRARFTSRRPQSSTTIETFGEAFADGTFIELVHHRSIPDAFELLLWDGKTAEFATHVKYRERNYTPAIVDPTVVRELHLPAKFHRDESVPGLVADLVEVIQRYSGLDDTSAGLIARFALGSWVADALPASPALMFVGPNSRELQQVFALLKCICRHAMPLAEVTLNGLCMLPLEIGLTLLIHQTDVQVPVERFLVASRKREWRFPRGGRLIPVFSSLALHCMEYSDAATIGAVAVPITPTDQALPILDDRERARIAELFQPRLLSYRFAHFEKIRTSTFDCGVLHVETRDSINAFAACTPENPELQAEIMQLVPAQVEEARQTKYTNETVVLIESLLLACHTPDLKKRYMREVADALMTIFSARGDERQFMPHEVGQMIRHLGFKVEPRDKRGFKLLLDDATRRKIHELAVNFDVPSADKPVEACTHCEAVRQNRKQSEETTDPTEPDEPTGKV
jgi:hypothetical protein